MEPADELLNDEASLELSADPMRLNMGPSHPAMHGSIILSYCKQLLKYRLIGFRFNVTVGPGFIFLEKFKYDGGYVKD